MTIHFSDTSLPGVFLIEPPRFEDSRGFFMETYHEKKYAGIGIRRRFVQDNHARSRQGVLRGLHYQMNHPQAKLVYVVTGEIFDVAVDIRYGSPTFGKWVGVRLSGENRRQIFIPEGFAHGYAVLSKTADVIYKCSDLYAPEDEFGILWSDPAMGIAWPVKDPVISEKDQRLPGLKDVPEHHLPAYGAGVIS